MKHTTAGARNNYNANRKITFNRIDYMDPATRICPNVSSALSKAHSLSIL